MPQQYTVKPGETLWGIAQKMLGAGSRWKELGYTDRPGSLQVGTVLNIPTEPPQERATEIRTQLTGETPTPTEPKPFETRLGTFGGGSYDIGGIQENLTSAAAEKKKAYDEMMGIQSKLYETEYEKAGLDATKQKIYGIDTSIQERKAQRDAMLLDERGKPIPQWMIASRESTAPRPARTWCCWTWTCPGGGGSRSWRRSRPTPGSVACRWSS